MNSGSTNNGLKPVALGLAFAILWVISLLSVVFMALVFGVGFPWLGILASVYIGFSLTFWGVVIGIVWAFVDGFVGGFLLAWLYNWLSGCCRCQSSD